MTTEATAGDKALAAHGAGPENVSGGERGAGNPLPKPIENAPPQDEAAKAAAAAAAAKGAEPTAEEKKAADDALLEQAEAIRKQREADAAAERKDWQKEYIKLDHAEGQAVVDLLNEAGVSPIEANAIFEKAVASGDMNDIDWATLENKLGPAKTRLAKAGIERFANDVVQPQAETKKAAFEIMGGEENWNKVRTWAQGLEKTDKAWAGKVAEFRKAIDLGGFAAKAAVTELRKAYEADPKNTGLGTGTLTQGNTTAKVEGALSRTDYVREIQKAEASRASPAVFQALHARRRAGMQAGI